MAFVIALCSCNSGDSGQSTPPVAADTRVAAAPAHVYDTILIKGKVTHTTPSVGVDYSLYLPTFYTPGRSFPCIYFFDAHARGVMPVYAYRELAEKYGFILVGSNVSKNGDPLETTQNIVNALFADTRSRFNIDTGRVYTSGFSGGSRVASTIAIMAGDVTGVIGCAAGFPPLQHGPKTRFAYFGIVGSYDFNLAEMERLDETLQTIEFPHQLLVFPGGHQWPSAADFRTAMLWMQVAAMKQHLQPQNELVIKELKSDFDARIAALTAAGEWIRVRQLHDGIISALDGLADVFGYVSRREAIIAGKDYANALALQERLWKTETERQKEFAKQFAEQDVKRWAAEIGKLQGEARKTKIPLEAQMARRCLSYLGLLSYKYTSKALKENDIAGATKGLSIFKMADPGNPDLGYLAAVLHMQEGRKKQAIASLGEAAAAGYSDLVQLTTDTTFRSLYNDPGFGKIVQKVTKNLKSE